MTPNERVASLHGGAVPAEDRPSSHRWRLFPQSSYQQRQRVFLPINPIVILITGRLGVPGALRSRAILGAGQLIRVAVRPARARIIPEPTEALPLLRVGPDHQIPPTSDPPEMDVALLHSIVELVVHHVQLVRPVADPPLVRPERLRRPGSGTETESVDQFPGWRRGELVVAVRNRTEVIPIEALGDLFECDQPRPRARPGSAPEGNRSTAGNCENSHARQGVK